MRNAQVGFNLETRSEGLEADIERAIKEKHGADGRFIGDGQEEINENKEVTKNYLDGARKVIPKLPKP